MLLVDTLFDSIELTRSHTNLFILASGNESHMTQFGWLLNINCIATNQGWSHDLELGGKHTNKFFFETPNKYSFRKLSLFVCFFFFFECLALQPLRPFLFFFRCLVCCQMCVAVHLDQLKSTQEFFILFYFCV